MQNSPKNYTLADRANVAEKRIELGASSAYALRRAIIHNKITNEEIHGLCHRVWTCSEPENHFVGDDLHNRQTGELYAGNGNLWGCGSKLCPSCVAKSSNRSRKELNLSLKNQKLLTGEMYQLITLTMPNPGLSLLQTRKIMDRAWSLLRKREYFKEKIRGASKSEEFVIKENGYHYHFHLLGITRFLHSTTFRREWTECLITAFREMNLPCKFNTKDKLAVANIERVSSFANGLKGAVSEVCKYITKSDSWEKISEKDLLDIAQIERFPRMFELIGYFRTQRNANAVLEHPNVFITYLLSQLLVDVLQNIKKIIDSGANTNLDTKEISDGENSTEPRELPDKVPKVERQANWRKYIAEFGLEDYLERLAEQVYKTRETRKYFLKYKYEFASFQTMDGIAF